MKGVTMLRLALAGSRTDRLRVTLTTVSATLAMLAVLSAATVIAIPDPADGYAGRYTSTYLDEVGLRPGVITALVLLVIPTLALAAQCGRLGAPARDRRLAAIRLAGATPRQAIRLVAVETGLASALGASAGLVTYLVGRQLLHQPNEQGLLPLPTDVLPSPFVIAAVLVAFPFLATAVAVFALRKVTVGPFGVVRRVRTGSPPLWPGFLILPGIAVVAILQPVTEWAHRRGMQLPDTVFLTVVGLGALLTIIGVIMGTGWLSYTTGRLLVRGARKPAALLAGRRLMVDPWSGSRAFAVVLTAVVFGSAAVGVKAVFLVDLRGRQDIGFYLQGFDLVNAAVAVAGVLAALGLLVTMAEAIVSRRRTYAQLTASGVSRSVLSRAHLWQVLAPMALATLIATAAGYARTRALFGQHEEVEDAGVSVGVPYTELVLVAVIAIGVVFVMTSISLSFLRASTHPAELRTT